MILHAKYQDDNGNVVWLNEMDGSNNVFYIAAGNLVHATIEFFQSKYRLAR